MDAQTKRLGGAIIASLLVNGLLWRAFGSVVLGQKAAPPQIIEISRVILSKSGPPKTKVVTPRQIRRRVEQIRKLAPPKRRRLVRPLNTTTRPHRVVPPLPRLPRPLVQKPPREAPQSNKPTKPLPQRPEGAHNRTLTAQQKAASDAGTVKTGGNAEQGKPINAQNYGKKKSNPANYSTPLPQSQPTQPPFAEGTPEARATLQPPAPTPAPLPDPTATPTPRPTATPVPEPTNTPRPKPTNTPRPDPTNTPKPEPTNTPRPEPTNTPRPTPRPEPTNTPRPRGATRKAIPVRQPQPDIPDSLKDSSFKSSVSVTVSIDADGSSSPSLRGTSGNAQIDALVLSALRRWRWKPALEDGVPVASSQRFRFDFVVR
ncbi:hypothetical protein IAD21_01171 [Abditibacteriota bacterium]|nr:hypothetical protein IAD21_01171 [Abditibacteriota bacterium]